MRTLTLVVALGALSGCGADESNSLSCDRDDDADHLGNCEEQTHGTDPDNPDTDADGYLDGDEVLENKSPVDPNSRIYIGNWPYQRFKSELGETGFDGAPAAGARVPRLRALDQHGEIVDLYDFAGHDKPVVIDLSAVWCDACKDLALWIEGEPSNLDAAAELRAVVDRVAAGEVFWITVLFEDRLGNPATPQDAKSWAETFPHPKVAVLVDDDRALRDWFFPGTMPSVHVTDASMQLVVYDRFDYEIALAELL